MKLEIGVKRPVATAMLFTTNNPAGIVSLKMLPLDLMPEMEFPSVTVITVYPGASASRVGTGHQPLETVLSAAERLTENQIDIEENVSFIQLSYEWGGDVTSAANNGAT